MREKDHLNKYYGLSKVYKQGPVNYHLDLVLQKNQFSFTISSKLNQSQEEGRRETISEYIKMYYPFLFYLMTV